MGQGLRTAQAVDAPKLAVAALEELEKEVRRAVLERLGARRAELKETERRVQQVLTGVVR